MSDLDRTQNASFEAHMAAVASLSQSLGVATPPTAAVAHALAHAYGEMMAIYSLSGATDDDFTALAATCVNAEMGALSRMHQSTCAGSA